MKLNYNGILVIYRIRKCGKTTLKTYRNKKLKRDKDYIERTKDLI